MPLETAMRDALLAVDDVTDIVVNRIFAWQRDENSDLPAIVWRTVMEDPKQGLSTSQDLSESIVEFECIAASLSDARTLAEAVRQALAGTTGALGDVSHLAIRHTKTRDNFTDPYDGSAQGTFSVTVEFTVLFRTLAIA